MKFFYFAQTFVLADERLEQISEGWPILIPSRELRKLNPGQRDIDDSSFGGTL